MTRPQVGRLARAHPTRVSTLLLVEPTFDTVDPARPPDVPLTVVLGQCDGDVGLDGARYYRDATRDRSRRAPDFKVLLLANHAFFNATWSARGQDDGPSAANPRAGELFRANNVLDDDRGLAHQHGTRRSS